MRFAQLVEEMKESNYIAAENNHIIGNIHEHLQAESLKQDQNRLDDLESERDQSQSGSPAGAPAGSGGGDKKAGVMAKSIAGAVGAGVKVGAMGVGAGVGLAALGFGIGGFFTGLSLGDKAQALIGTDMQATKRNMITLGEALDETPERGLMIMGGIMAGGGILGALAGVGNAAKAAAGMTAMGAGIGGFFAGLALGDKGAGLLNTDGSAISSMMKAVGEGLNAFDNSSLVALGALFAAAIAIGPAAAVAAVPALGALGAGVAAFFGGFAGVGELISKMGITGEELGPLLKNTADGLNPLTQIDGTNLLAVGAGMAAVGVGLAALYGAKGIGVIGDLAGKAMDFIFGKSEEDDIFTKTANNLKKLDIGGTTIDNVDQLASSFMNLGSGINAINSINFDEYSDQMESFAKATAKTIYLMNAMWEGTTVGSGWFDGLPEMNFSPGLKTGQIDDVTAKLTGISQIAGVQPNQAGQTINNSTTELNNISNSQAPIVVSAPVTKTVNSSPMSLSLGGGMSSTDNFDQGTR